MRVAAERAGPWVLAGPCGPLGPRGPRRRVQCGSRGGAADLCTCSARAAAALCQICAPEGRKSVCVCVGERAAGACDPWEERGRHSTGQSRNAM